MPRDANLPPGTLTPSGRKQLELALDEYRRVTRAVGLLLEHA